MFVEPIEVRVCKPCPKCGMPDIMQYRWGGITRFSITCKNRCKHVGNECTNLDDAIAAWNVLIEGQEKPAEVKMVPYREVKFERQVKPIRKIAGLSQKKNEVVDDVKTN